MDFKKRTQKLNFIDVFSGAGGLSCGLEMAGLNCLLGIDYDKHAMATFAQNHQKAKIFCGDIRELTPELLLALTGGKKVHAVVGGPPCQGFSTAGTGDPKDKRNSLFMQFLRITKELNPYFIIIENVTGLLAKKNEKSLKAIIRKFSSMGYNLDVRVLSSQNYGAPEIRRRTIFVGTRINQESQFPKIDFDTYRGKRYIPPVTIGDAFKDLKDKNGVIHNHNLEFAQIPNKLDLSRLKLIPEGKGIRYQRDEEKYFPKRLRLDVDWENLRENRFRQTKYQRLDRKLPSPTIMTHRHSYYHPTEHRYLTQREAATCQSFPKDFIFCGPVSAQWRQIGNAVPPLLGKALGKTLKKMYKEASPELMKKNTPGVIPKNHKIISNRSQAFNYR
ncbi:MAG: DNA cytosine methyltransferase [Epsilonproteobacteria bacterium]|nr:MAG: DNA cytosine methyltransferase [Campylobacterota bacterium]RLA67093.1 MAG: DNA cytosine methyltransferase [Campylobacterota bacterium]